MKTYSTEALEEVDEAVEVGVVEEELTDVAGSQLYSSWITRNLQLLEAVTTELDAVETDDEERDERLEVEVVPATIELVEDGVGVGEMVVSSSVEMIEVRVELEMTVDWAEA